MVFITAVGKYAYPVFKLAKGAKILLTAGSMLLSIGAYALLFGWKFAVGLVICIFIHEMGHVFAAYLLGIPVSAPIFIPFMGALILQKRSGGSAWNNALIGIGGPTFGCLAAAACYGLYLVTGNQLFLGLSLTGFLLNLFNMIPMFPLDGGWITGAISPYIWVGGLVLLVVAAFKFGMYNPFILLLIILSLPRLVGAFKRGTMDDPGTQTSPGQKVAMGLAYVMLSGTLAAGFAVAGVSLTAARMEQATPHNASGSAVALRLTDHVLDQGQAFHHAGKADGG